MNVTLTNTSKLKHNLVQLKEHENFNYGNYFDMVSTNKSKYYNFSYEFFDKDKFIYEIKRVNKLKNIKNKFIIGIEDYDSGVDSGFCSTSYYLNIYNNMKKYVTVDSFKSEQGGISVLNLKALVVNIIKALSNLQKNRIYHGNIHKDFIFYNKFKNKFKLLYNYRFFNHYELLKKKIFNNELFYCSPELFNQFITEDSNKNNYYKDNHNVYKEEAFQIGLLILDLIDEDIMKIYDFKNKKISENILKELILNFEKKIIQGSIVIKEEVLFIVDLLHNLLKINVKERFDLIAAEDFINSKLKIDNPSMYFIGFEEDSKLSKSQNNDTNISLNQTNNSKYLDESIFHDNTSNLKDKFELMRSFHKRNNSIVSHNK